MGCCGFGSWGGYRSVDLVRQWLEALGASTQASRQVRNWNQVTQVFNQVTSQVNSQVWNQVTSQVNSQVWNQVISQVNSQVNSQVWNQASSQVWDQENKK
jgi:cobalamin biosynthesis protein CbiD